MIMGKTWKVNIKVLKKKLLDINPKAFHRPCECHSLNLTLCDMVNSCVKAKDLFLAVQGIYNLFSNYAKRWKILKEHVKTNVKPLLVTRWESHFEVVKAIRFQASELRGALFEISENDNDNDVKSQANSLAILYVGNFEFLVAMIVWNEILHGVNLISKRDNLICAYRYCYWGSERFGFFSKKEYMETRFIDDINTTKDIAIERKIVPVFKIKPVIWRKKHFDENATVEDTQLPKDSFRTNYFLYIVDQATGSLERRFDQFTVFEKKKTLCFYFLLRS